MASITKRIRADGTIVYKAEIVIKKDGVIVHRESKTFDKQKLSKDWAMRREVELQKTDVYAKKSYLPIREVIEKYLKDFPPSGRSKLSDLLMLSKQDIGSIDIHKLSTSDLIRHIRFRNTICKPQTAGNDLIWLNTVIKTMSAIIDLGIDMSIFDSARRILHAEGLIAHSKKRERIPLKSELWAISRWFFDKPFMLHIIWFAIYSARRQSEIMRIEWDDIRHEDRTCLIRDIKDPRKKGLVVRCKLPMSAYKIIMRQPKTSKFVFPYNSKTIGAYHTRACKMLGIDDLHFHDYRHLAATRLFNAGLSIQQVQQITLHKTWSSLQRYVNMQPGDIDI
ncbi:tyrosine-type recombinase/integrase [Methylobacter sp. S3L5C]|uniref:tyrosine-type recombinase/integrase n=1 Tax=Methylobacter sp. S3L5C TaxID=2839024 RepID=UPI001FADED6C|nr:tyrosine-type recombinase/integrase [Methylobacter sp. S3L5C]UOA08313.1 tyrosine-type recombinase/integrase [Methylobacter sp. S3L5C]